VANGVNKVILLGNLGADPEMRYTQGGTAVMSLRLATAESYKDSHGDWQERTEWHNVTVWAARAEGLAKVLTKGSRLYIEGSLRTSSYEDREGVKRYKTEINAQNVVLCGGKQDGQSSQSNQAGGKSASRPAPNRRPQQRAARGDAEERLGGHGDAGLAMDPAEEAYEAEVVGVDQNGNDVPF
jgi:single-strand DNA-binding protein